jgi:hypothetical protein
MISAITNAVTPILVVRKLAAVVLGTATSNSRVLHMLWVDYGERRSVGLSIVPANGIPKRTRLPVHVRKNRNIAHNIGIALALLHTSGFLALAFYIHKLTDPQAPLLWLIFVIIDFPLSLLYLLGGALHSYNSALGEFIYGPYLIHGLLAPVWWYFLPKLLTPRRFGGLW